MPNYNKVILMGNLTDKPELRYSQAGNAWCRFTIAVNDRYTSREGETVERVSFVDVTSFDKQAETLCQYLDKGSPLLVEGRLALDRWETEEGEPRSKLRVVLRRFQFVGGRREERAAA